MLQTCLAAAAFLDPRPGEPVRLGVMFSISVWSLSWTVPGKSGHSVDTVLFGVRRLRALGQARSGGGAFGGFGEAAHFELEGIVYVPPRWLPSCLLSKSCSFSESRCPDLMTFVSATWATQPE